ncbi:MAG TPA: lysophospholipid acyltransferase family protein [Candidatus Cloacimonadota bacterium]|nr:lysophospholipid acyltransferase family protein [Candidatus Cloacimonadota bacterium]HOH60509.1 lysophospholipid acyltransferase family protein [Candidatus Cloacimonadota bacterium]
MNNLQNKLEYYSFRGLIVLLSALPYASRKAIVCLLFDLVGYRFGIRREVAVKQMRKVYPDWSQTTIKRHVKKLYRQMALNILEVYLMDDATLNARSVIVGEEYVNEALALGRGAILATAHFGNWEAARILPLRDMPVSVITKRQRNKLFDAYTNGIRERNGVHTIDMKRGLRDILKDLRENRIVAILSDQNAGSAGMVLDFLGYPASHWKGVAKLSLRYDIPIIPGFVVREEDDTLRFEFHPMLRYPDLADDEANYRVVLSDITRITEEYIHKYPHQWFWVHKRWKHAYDMFK